MFSVASASAPSTEVEVKVEVESTASEFVRFVLERDLVPREHRHRRHVQARTLEHLYNLKFKHRVPQEGKVRDETRRDETRPRKKKEKIAINVGNGVGRAKCNFKIKKKSCGKRRDVIY